jgi:hypothetical protein
VRSRQDILRCARELAQAVAESSELTELQRCEAALAKAGGLDALEAEDPVSLAYTAAKENAERLIRQVTSVFLFPLTGSLQTESGAQEGCAGCVR